LILTVVFFVVAWQWGRIRLGMGTLPALLLIGPAISLGASFTPGTLPLAGDALAFMIGLILFALGISLSSAAKLGPDGVTALSLAAEKRHAWPVPKANLLWNGIAICLGILLGGHFGIATVIGLFAVPLLIRMFLPWLRSGVVRR
jgi:uncharacterized membrane protein YczE